MLCLLLSISFRPLQGRYGCCRFLRDGYRTPKEVSVPSTAPCQNLSAKQQPLWVCLQPPPGAAQRLWWRALGR